MKIFNICVYVILFCVSSIVQAKRFNCEDLATSDYKQVSKFDSEIPFLQSNLITYNSDGSLKSEDKTIYISQKSVCSINLDFKTDCKIIERQSILGYDFSFECKKQNVFGQFYVDENGWGRLNCNGQAQSQFLDCKPY